MRKTLLVLLLLIAPGLFAENADLLITNHTLNRAIATTGERFTFDLSWRNDGPDAARNVRVEVSGTPNPFFILNVATNGWPCYPLADGSSFLCQNARLDPGASANLVIQMLTPPSAGTFRLRASVTSAVPDPNLSNNTIEVTAELAAAPSADLSMTPTTQLQVASPGEQVSMTVDIANESDHEIDNPIAYFAVPVTDEQPSFTVDGDGWSCGALVYGPQAYICSRSRLAAGVHAPITITTRARQSEGSFTIYGRVRGEAHSDPFTLNDAATMTVRVGEDEVEPPPPVEWKRILLPVLGADIPGTGGSLWRTEVTALMATDAQLFVRPNICDFAQACAGPVFPLRRPFDAYATRFVGFVEGAVGQFVYVRDIDEARLHFNARVYDVARQAETAGAEVPVPRGDDFTNAPVSLVGIPVAPQYRHTLRIYDLDARAGGQVQIRLYANAETTPRATLVRTLNVPQGARMLDGINLPSHPGVIQLELGQHLSLAGLQTVRVDIEPIDAGLKLWSFVSVTNNDTHHVTTFSQH
jgi:hypothetical protein